MTDLLDEMIALTEALLRAPDERAPAPAWPLALPPAPVDAPVDAPADAPVRVAASPPVSILEPIPAVVVRPAPARAPRPVARVGILLIVLLALPTVAPGFRVRVGGHTVTLHDRAPTVALALTRAGFVAHDGPLVAVMSGRALDRHFDRARVRVDGKVRPLAARVANGDSLQLLNGHPVVETTVHRESRIPGGGLPEIEYELWQPPVAGATDQLVGAASGEIVSEVPVRAPVNATPVTDASVALSFDDGPNPQWTPAILAILRDANIKATFCVVGYAAERYPALVRQIAAEGHTLCNHTVHHVQMLGRKSAPEIDAELRGNSDIIEKAAGVRPLFFRAPGGTWAQNLVDAVHSQGMRALGWNVDPADYRRPGAAVISATILHHVRPGAVVLMHDGGGDRSQTVAQLRALIEHLRAMGYSFRVPTA